MLINEPIALLSFRQHVSRYTSSLSGNFWLIIGLSATLTALVVALCAVLPESYKATATICYSTQIASQDVSRWGLVTAGDRFLATQTRLIQADAILRPVANQYRLLDREHQTMRAWISTYPSEERSAIEGGHVVLRNLVVTAVPHALCLNITYRDRNPQVAADVVNALANSLVSATAKTPQDGNRSFGASVGEAATPSREATRSPMVGAEKWSANNNVVMAASKIPSLSLGSELEHMQADDDKSLHKITTDHTGGAQHSALASAHMAQRVISPAAEGTAAQCIDAHQLPVPALGHSTSLGQDVGVVDPARPPAQPAFPNWPFIVFFCFGFFSTSISLCTVLVGSREFITGDPDVMEQLLGVNVISKLPRVDHIQIWMRRRIGCTLLRGFCLEGVLFEEGIRLLQNDILLCSSRKMCKSVLVTSALPGEGKTTVSVSLAIGYAEQGKRTLLIDADLRCQTVAERLPIYPPGRLDSVLAKTLPWKAALSRVVGCPDLSVLSSPIALHDEIPVVAGLVASILRDAELEYDVVVIDSPPLLGCGESSELGAIADVTLLCVRSGCTSLEVQKAALERLRRVGARFAGIVLNEHVGHKDSVSKAYEKYHVSQAARWTGPESPRPVEAAPCSSDTLRR